MTAHWDNFYVIVGSAGAALISVQFVVVTLVANMRRRPSGESFTAFATPTVVHFSVVVAVSAIMSAPWFSLTSPSIAIALCGVAGIVYSVLVIRRQRQQTDYAPVFEDWLWYALFPCVAYAAMALGAPFLRARPHAAQFVVATTALALLLIGVHNAWDSVTHLVVTGRENGGGDIANSGS